MRPRLVVPLLVAALVLPAACGDDDDADAGGTTTSTVELTGPPIKVGAIVERLFEDPREEAHVAAEAAVAGINADGGINGRPLEIEICDAKQNDPNSATDCARGFADDPDIVATVGMWSIVAEGANGVLSEAGLASIGNSPLGGADFQCQVCFPVSGGALASVAGQANLIDDVLGDDVGMVVSDVPAGQQLVGLVKAVIAARGSAATLNAVPVPVAVADISAQVAATRDNDGVAIVIPRDTALSYIRSARGSGGDVPVVITTQVMTGADIETLGADAEGMYVVHSYALEGDGVDEFNEAMEATDPDALRTDPAKSMWLAVRLFADVARDLTDISRASVLDAMGKLSGYETGMTPPIDFTKEFTGVGGTLPRVFNTAVYYAVVEDGEQVPVGSGEPVDVFSPPKG